MSHSLSNWRRGCVESHNRCSGVNTIDESTESTLSAKSTRSQGQGCDFNFGFSQRTTLPNDFICPPSCDGHLGKRPTSSRPSTFYQDLDARIVTPTDVPHPTLSDQILMFKKQKHASASSSSSEVPLHHLCSLESRNPLEMLSNVSSCLAKKQVKSSYVGSRNEAGQMHGKGIMNYENGCRYVGHFVNGKREGYGKFLYSNGCVYSGYWRDGKREGFGKMSYLEGGVYEGEWVMDQRHGPGTYLWGDGRADVCVCYKHKIVGEGVQWSPCRKRMWRLIDGDVEGPISAREALAITSKIGLPGIPTLENSDSLQGNTY